MCLRYHRYICEDILMKCKLCGLSRIFQNEKVNGSRYYLCTDYKQTFTEDDRFPDMSIKFEIVTTALNLYFKSLTIRKVQQQISKLYGVYVRSVAVWKWIMNYSRMVADSVESKPELPGKWHVDETVIKFRAKWFWASIDWDTKFLVSTHPFNDRTRHLTTCRTPTQQAKVDTVNRWYDLIKLAII